MLPQKLSFIDLETTGGSFRYGRVIEVGIVRVEQNQVVSTYKTLINPHTYVPDEIFTLTGINPGELENAPSFDSIYKDILEILEDSVFVAHNVRFDYSFLRQEFKRLGISFSSKHFCTVKLSRALYPQYRHHNLDSIIERFGFECESRHRAFDDAHVLWQFYQKIQQDIEETKLLESLNKALKKPTLPINISQETLDNLPEAPGVYIFFGAGGMPLYVGKSINIRERVLSHFSSDINDSKEMNISQQVESIETIVTAGELGALIKEAALVKKLQPLYNRKLRLSRKMIILRNKTNEQGYRSIEIDESGLIDVGDIENILGVFRSRRQAKDFLIEVAKKYELCEKLLGLEKTSSGCFGYRLGRCKGGCLGKESSLKYNLRMILAFAQTKIRTWPFNGPVLIKEEGEDGQGETFLVDKWCLVEDSEYIFDLDTYKIINSFLNKESNLKKVNTQFVMAPSMSF